MRESRLAVWHHTEGNLSVNTPVISPEPQLFIQHTLLVMKEGEKEAWVMSMWSTFWPSQDDCDDFSVFRLQFSFSDCIRSGEGWKKLKSRGLNRGCFQSASPRFLFSYTPWFLLGKISQIWNTFLNPASVVEKDEGERGTGWLWGGQFTVYFHLFLHF